MRTKIFQFNVNDFVWAKVTGYSYWPAIVVVPNPLAPSKPQDDMQWIYFFGTYNYAWIHEKFIKPYEEYKKQYTYKCTQGVLEANRELKYHKRQLAKNPDYEIDFVKFTKRDKRPRSSRSNRSSRSSTRSKKQRVDSEASGTTSPASIQRPRSVLSDAPDEDQDLEPEEVSSIRKDVLKITKKPVGVLACNIYAEGIAKNLLLFEHDVHVWTPSLALFNDLRKVKNDKGTQFQLHKNLRHIVSKCSIIFSCFSSCDEAKAILYELGANDDNDPLLRDKVYIEMTSIDYETSYSIEDLMRKKRAGYMEAMIQGTRKEVENREMRILVGGRGHKAHKILADYKSCFWALGTETYFVGEIGAATKIHGMAQMMKAVFLAGFAEALALADKFIDTETFFEIFMITPLYSKYFERVCKTIINKDYFNIQETIMALQEDLKHMIEMSDKYRQAVPLASTANQLFKYARRLGLDDRDSSCIYLCARQNLHS